MKQNGGAGKLLVRDSALVQGDLQVASANRHANGRDWWILLANNEKGLFYRYLLTPAGLQGPWQQEIANPTAQKAFFYGWSQFSPDGRYYAIHQTAHGVSVYDFDRCDGTLSNLRYLPRYPTELKPSWNFGMTISPNSRYLYRVVNTSTRIVQYDLKAPDLGNSEIIIADSMAPVYRFSHIHTGPDGKIYVWYPFRKFINTIEMPNRRGMGANVRFQSVKLPTYSSGSPIYYPNYRLGPLDHTACDTLGIDNLPEALWRHDLEDTLQALRVTFTDLSYYEPAEWYWSFGDGTFSRDTSPVHAYAQAGTYEVCLVVKNENASDTLCRKTSVGTTSGEDLGSGVARVLVFPNPAREDITVLLKQQPHQNEIFFMLHNSIGQVVRQQTLSTTTNRVDIAGLRNGLYFATVSKEGKVIAHQKIVVLH